MTLQHVSKRVLWYVVISFFILGALSGCGGSSDSGGTGWYGGGDGGGATTPTAGITVSPSANDQIIPCGNGVQVMVPGGMLQSEQSLTVTPVSNPPIPSQEYLTIRKAYEVNLGEMHELGDKEMVVAIPYAQVGSEDPLVNYFGAYYDDTSKNWITLPTSISTEKKVLFVHTRHLSKIAYGATKGTEDGWIGVWSFLRNEKFTLLYDKTEATNESVGWTMHPNAVQVQDEPAFISDAWYYLNNAYNIYLDSPNNLKDLYYGTTTEYWDDGLVQTKWFGQRVYVQTPLIGQSSARRSKYTGNVTLTYKKQNTLLLQLDAAHELFHCFQNRYYYTTTMTFNGYWWMESTADYAASRLVAMESILIMTLGLAEMLMMIANSGFRNLLIGGLELQQE